MMKKFIVLIGVIGILGMASPALASNECETTGHPAGTSSLGIDYIGCGGGDPMNQGMPWGSTGYNTPQIKAGVTVTDEAGITDTCPTWYRAGCFDLSKTDYYRTQMRTIARNLQSSGWISQFPKMMGWLSR